MTAQFTDADFRAAIAAERENDRKAAAALVASIEASDVDAFYEAVDFVQNCSVSGWDLAFKKIKKLRSVTADIKQAFFRVWVESKSLRGRAADDFELITCLRVLLPPYDGPTVTLYRGDTFIARCRRTYGISWTDDAKLAEEKFATDHRQMSPGGSVLLKAIASPEAIIATTHEIGDHYNEREYLVDRRLLGPVSVVKRFPQRLRA